MFTISPGVSGITFENVSMTQQMISPPPLTGKHPKLLPTYIVDSIAAFLKEMHKLYPSITNLEIMAVDSGRQGLPFQQLRERFKNNYKVRLSQNPIFSNYMLTCGKYLSPPDIIISLDSTGL